MATKPFEVAGLLFAIYLADYVKNKVSGSYEEQRQQRLKEREEARQEVDS
jgi:hypothetical protein